MLGTAPGRPCLIGANRYDLSYRIEAEPACGKHVAKHTRSVWGPRQDTPILPGHNQLVTAYPVERPGQKGRNRSCHRCRSRLTCVSHTIRTQLIQHTTDSVQFRLMIDTAVPVPGVDTLGRVWLGEALERFRYMGDTSPGSWATLWDSSGSGRHL